MATEEQDRAEGSVRAVARALDVLLAFRPGDNELLVAELLKRVHLSRPTLYRLLDTLVSKQFLVSEGEPQRFRLGPAVAHLAHAWTATLSYSAVAQPMMRRLWEATSETVSLHVHEGPYRVSVAEMASPQPLSFRRGVGFRDKLLLGASGRSILAWLEVDAKALMGLGAQNAAEAAKYLAQLQQIRKRGFETSRDEMIQGAVAIAAPFFDGSGRVIGSIGLFGPSVRLTKDVVEHYGSLLVQEARQLSMALGLEPTATPRLAPL